MKQEPVQNSAMQQLGRHPTPNEPILHAQYLEEIANSVFNGIYTPPTNMKIMNMQFSITIKAIQGF